MGSYVISVSLGTGCYRHIQIAASATLYQLHKAILNAFDFADDHAHAFFMDNKVWSEYDAYFSTKSESTDRLTKRYRLETLGLSVGNKFKYLFDFGDEWTFQCKVLRVLEEHTDIPCILRSVGESPEQYFDFDDEWDADWEEENETDEDEDDIPILPPEAIDALYASLPLKKSVITCIHQYLDAAERLYGTIPLKKLYDIYNSQNTPVSEEAFLLVAEIANFEGNPYLILQRNRPVKNAETEMAAADLVSDYLLGDDNLEDYRRLCLAQGAKPYKILPKKEFLRYAVDGYYPTTPENIAMLNYLRRRKSSLSHSAEDFCVLLQDLIAIDARLQDILDWLEPEGLTFDHQGDIEEFISLFMELNNHTPKHANRGYTPNELSSLSAPEQKAAVQNVLKGQLSLSETLPPLPKPTITKPPARNAPCPCGSGKKYKNCCGKH